MGKTLQVWVEDSEYDLVKKMAKIENKTISLFLREKIMYAIKKDMKETTTLQKMVQVLENISENISQQNVSQPTSNMDAMMIARVQDEINRKMYAIFELVTVFANQFFLDKTKAEKFLEQVKNIEKKFF